MNRTLEHAIIDVSRMKSKAMNLIHHKKIFIPILIVVIGIVLYILSRPSPVSQIATQEVTRKELVQSLQASGTIDATESVDLTFGVGGKVMYLGAKKGDAVKAGQVIATLDQRSAQKNLETSLRNYSEQRNTFEQTKENYNSPLIDNAANIKIKRILENNQYDLEKSVLSVELQSLVKEQSVLTTPINGIVTRADITSPGVNAGITTTFSIANPADMVFKMDIDEADIGKVQEGQTVSLMLNAFTDTQLQTRVQSIDFATHTTSTGGSAFTVEAFLPDNLVGKYRLGMTGDAEIILQKKDAVLVVPVSSIIDEKYVYVKNKNAFEKREILVGITNDTEAEVVTGLQKGDSVALDPTEAEKIKPKKYILF